MEFIIIVNNFNCFIVKIIIINDIPLIAIYIYDDVMIMKCFVFLFVINCHFNLKLLANFKYFD